MVKNFKSDVRGLDRVTIFSFSCVILLTVVVNWIMFSFMFHETIQEILYPYSSYPVVVYSIGETIVFSGWAILCLVSLLIINHLLLIFFQKSYFLKIKSKLLQGVAALLVIAVVLLVLEFIGWPMAAKAHGYSPCPHDTLLVGQKTSTAWVKDISFCYDQEVKKRFPTGSYQQVLDVAKYLNKEKVHK